MTRNTALAYRLTPHMSRRVQVLLALVALTVPGVLLTVRGSIWVVGGFTALGVAVAVVAGATVAVLKSRFILDRVARRSLERTRMRSLDACGFGFFSPATWAAVAVMIVGGHFLRESAVPKDWLGVAYIAIGLALLVSTRILWKAIFRPI